MGQRDRRTREGALTHGDENAGSRQPNEGDGPEAFFIADLTEPDVKNSLPS
jgi:hypothetical protein